MLAIIINYILFFPFLFHLRWLPTTFPLARRSAGSAAASPCQPQVSFGHEFVAYLATTHCNSGSFVSAITFKAFFPPAPFSICFSSSIFLLPHILLPTYLPIYYLLSLYLKLLLGAFLCRPLMTRPEIGFI